MATKLKTILRSSGLKITAAILAIIFFASGIYVFERTILTTDRQFGVGDTFDNADFYQSNSLHWMVGDVYMGIYDVVDYYQSEDHIRSGALISNTEIDEYKETLFREDDDNGVWDMDDETLGRIEYSDGDTESYGSWMRRVIDSEEFNSLHAQDIENYKQQLINEDLSDYNYTLNSLNNLAENYGLMWTATGPDDVKSMSGDNVTADKLKSYRVYYVNDKGRIDTSMKDMRTYDYNYQGFTNYQNETAHSGSASSGSFGNTNCTIALAFGDEQMAELASVYNSERVATQQGVSYFCTMMMASVVAVILACFGAGHRKNDNAIRLIWVDKIGLDLHFIIAIPIAVFLVFISGAFVAYWSSDYMGILAALAGGGLIVNWLLSAVRIVKARQLSKKLWIISGCRRLGRWIKRGCGKLRDYYYSVIKGSPAFWLFLGMVALCLLGFFLTPVFVGLLILFALIWLGGRQARRLDEVMKGVKRIHDGEIDYQIAVKGKGPFVEMADNINTIRDGLNASVEEAVEKELKSERLKTELITNVSHDIRTPLTSIITYIDLMKKPDTTEEDRAHYLDVLTTKADRLKALTDDLFEAAKASTGNIEVHYDTVNMESLLDQGMGELEDRIAATNLKFIIERPAERLLVHADGRLLWRVVGNLLSNVIKYAMDGSRVYISMYPDTEEGMGVFVIKNISATELNIPAEELMERFKRGDDTRHSEGSGLGLAIARDLTTLQQGSFELSIDGDLFKATVKIPLAEQSADIE